MHKIEDIIPAIVQDFYSGQVLMLAYVNQDSYDYMAENGTTCFWSRSRQKLWHKGETSGNVQTIKHMAFDCGDNALLIQVEQAGTGACRKGGYSCFGNEIGEYDIINNVYAQIVDRENNPKENSYTNYLLDKGVDKICKKIGEESAETIIAAKNGSMEELVEEISDLAYHALVLMFTQGVSPREIRKKLSKRHMVEGNLKASKKKRKKN